MKSLKLVMAGVVVGVALASTITLAQENQPETQAAPAAQEAPAPPPPAPVARPRSAPNQDSGRDRPVVRDRGGERVRDGDDRAVPRPAPPPSAAPAPPPAPSGDGAPNSPSSYEQRNRGRRGPSSGGQASPRSQPRPRGNNPVVGTAVPRTDAPEFGRPPVTYLPRYRSYNNLYFPWGYAPFGLGYSWYDPLWWGYDYPYHPGSYGWYRDRDYYDGYGYTGTLRLKVKPRDAQVFTDGYFVGVVDEFDGILQSLKLEAGPHRIEVRLAGFEPLIFDVRIIPGETVTYRGELKPTRQP